MRDLCELFTDLKMQDARSLLQSGNIVFRSAVATPVELEHLLENAVQKRFGLTTQFFVRTAKQWKTIIGSNPFSNEAKSDPGHLLLMCLKDAPDRAAVTSLEKAITGRETVCVKGRHAYCVYPDGVGRSRLTNVLIERKLGTPGTGRNWNTVLKLGALCD